MPRYNISLPEPIVGLAHQVIAARHMAGLSDCIQILIREEYERRHPPTIPPSPAPAPAPASTGFTPAGAEQLIQQARKLARAPRKGRGK